MARRFVPSLVLLLLPAFVLLPTTVYGSTIRVDVDGGGDYTNLADAVAASAPGDTILVAPGRYTGPKNREIDAGHLAGNTCRHFISEAGAEETIIDLESASTYAMTLSHSDGLIDGFTFENAGGGPQAALILAGTDMLVRYCVFRNNAGDAIDMPNAATPYVRVIYSSFIDNGGTAVRVKGHSIIQHCDFLRNGAGVELINFEYEGTSARIWDCSFVDNAGTAVQTEGWVDTHDSVSADCRRDVFVGNGGGAVDFAISMYSDVHQCTFVENESGSRGVVHMDGAGAGSHTPVTQCVFAFNECVGVFSGEGVPPTERSSNIVYANAGGDSLGEGADGNWFIDPLLCDVEGGDVTPCADSFCLPDNNQLGIGAIGAYDTAGCGPCDDTPGEPVSWGGIKALYLPGR